MSALNIDVKSLPVNTTLIYFLNYISLELRISALQENSGWKRKKQFGGIITAFSFHFPHTLLWHWFFFDRIWGKDLQHWGVSVASLLSVSTLSVSALKNKFYDMKAARKTVEITQVMQKKIIMIMINDCL